MKIQATLFSLIPFSLSTFAGLWITDVYLQQIQTYTEKYKTRFQVC